MSNESAFPKFPPTLQPRIRETLAGLFDIDINDDSTLTDLETQLEWRYLSHGDLLIEQGVRGTDLYIVIMGRLRVEIEGEDGERSLIREIGSGEVTGELSLLLDTPRSANVTAVRDTLVAQLSRKAYSELVKRNPKSVAQMAVIVAKRQTGVISETPPIHAAISYVVIPLHEGAPTEQLIHHLSQQLSHFGTTRHLTSAAAAEQLSSSQQSQSGTIFSQNVLDGNNIELLGWINELEENFQYLIYQTDPTWTSWTERCLNQADRILLVASADADPNPNTLEAKVTQLKSKVRTELILVHPDNAIHVTGTSGWLTPRMLHTHHHVRLSSSSDIMRLARRIIGRTICIVFGGGGARGFAHIGVVRAIEEAGWDVDAIGGTSMGAFVGAGYANALTYEDMLSEATMFSSRKTVFDYTLPFTSLVAGKKVTGHYRRIFGDICIEDLWRPFFCISTNLTRAQPVIHDRGIVWRSIRASTSIPGVFPPLIEQEDVLVDGGVMNNFPLDVMRTRNESGTIIGVDVNPPLNRVKKYEYEAHLSGWKVLRSRLNPLERRIRAPSLIGSLMRTLVINSSYNLRRIYHNADLIIQPDVAHFSISAYGDYDAIIDLGYRAATEAFSDWQPAS